MLRPTGSQRLGPKDLCYAHQRPHPHEGTYNREMSCQKIDPWSQGHLSGSSYLWELGGTRSDWLATIHIKEIREALTVASQWPPNSIFFFLLFSYSGQQIQRHCDLARREKKKRKCLTKKMPHQGQTSMTLANAAIFSLVRSERTRVSGESRHACCGRSVASGVRLSLSHLTFCASTGWTQRTKNKESIQPGCTWMWVMRKVELLFLSFLSFFLLANPQIFIGQ